MARTDTESNSQARNDAYTGMLIVSRIALLAGGVLLFLDYNQYPDKKPPNVVKVAPEGPLPEQAAPEQKPAPKDDGKKK